jgi:hypothetical protein
MMKEPIPDGVAKGSLVTPGELDLLIDDYYAARGWAKAGLLKTQKLMELKLDDVAKERGVN